MQTPSYGYQLPFVVDGPIPTALQSMSGRKLLCFTGNCFDGRFISQRLCLINGISELTKTMQDNSNEYYHFSNEIFYKHLVLSQWASVRKSHFLKIRPQFRDGRGIKGSRITGSSVPCRHVHRLTCVSLLTSDTFWFRTEDVHQCRACSCLETDAVTPVYIF